MGDAFLPLTAFQIVYMSPQTYSESGEKTPDEAEAHESQHTRWMDKNRKTEFSIIHHFFWTPLASPFVTQILVGEKEIKKIQKSSYIITAALSKM